MDIKMNGRDYTLSKNITFTEYGDDPLISVADQVINYPKILDIVDDVEKELHKRQWRAETFYSTNYKGKEYFSIYVYNEQNHINHIDVVYLCDYGRDFAGKAFYCLLAKYYEKHLKKKTISECAEAIINKCGGDDKYNINLTLPIDIASFYPLEEYLENDVKATTEAYKKLKEEENMNYFDYNKESRIQSKYKEWLNGKWGLDKPVTDYDKAAWNSQKYKDDERHKKIRSMEFVLGIQKVKFQNPATIVFWDDGTKTVVKCQKGDTFDPEKGLAMAIIKKKVGDNQGYFNKIFEKWCPDEEPVDVDIPKETKRPKVFTETAEEVKKQKKIGDGYDDIRWEENKRGRK